MFLNPSEEMLHFWELFFVPFSDLIEAESVSVEELSPTPPGSSRFSSLLLFFFLFLKERYSVE